MSSVSRWVMAGGLGVLMLAAWPGLSDAWTEGLVGAVRAFTGAATVIAPVSLPPLLLLALVGVAAAPISMPRRIANATALVLVVLAAETLVVVLTTSSVLSRELSEYAAALARDVLPVAWVVGLWWNRAFGMVGASRVPRA